MTDMTELAKQIGYLRACNELIAWLTPNKTGDQVFDKVIEMTRDADARALA